MASIQLQLGMGSVIPMPVSAELADALVSAEVTTAVGSPSGFQLEFAVSKKSPITRTQLPNGAFDPGTRVLLQAIVKGMPHVLMDGIVTRQDLNPGDEPGTAKLTLTGQGLELLMDLHKQSRPYPALPAMARVALICVLPPYPLYGIAPAPVPPINIDIPLPIERIPVQAGMTDLEYINTLGAQVGHVFYIEPGPAPGVNIAYWGPEVRFGLVQPALTVDYGAARNVDDMSFSFDGLARTQLTVTIVEPHSKVGIPVPIPEVSVLKPPLDTLPTTVYYRTDLFPELGVARMPWLDEWLREVARRLDTGPKLVQTLDTFYRNNMGRTLTAAALHIHPRTLDYRLQRVHELTGLDPVSVRGVRILSTAVTRVRSGAWA